MKSKERLLRAIACKEPDKVPVAPRIRQYLNSLYGSRGDWTCFYRASKSYDFDLFVEVNPNINNYFRDVGTGFSDLPDVTVDVRTYKDGAGRAVKRIFHTPEGDLSDLTMVYPFDSTYGAFVDPIKKECMVKDANDLNKLKYIFPDPFKCDLSAIRHIQGLFGEDGLLRTYVYGLLGYRGSEGRQMEDLMTDYYEDRSFLKDYLGILHEQMMKETKACLEAGAEVIYVGNFHEGISAGWSPQHFEELFLPLYKQQIDLTHEYGAVYNYFDDGKMTGNLDNFIALGMDVLETLGAPPMGDVDLGHFKDKTGGKICLMGHIDLLEVIRNGTPEIIDRAVYEAIRVGGPGGGFIIGTSDGIREESPPENVQAYFDACSRYRDYPIKV